MGRPKVLFYGDYGCATGFAQVLGNVVREVARQDLFDIDVLGINYSGDPLDPKKWPGRVYPALSGIIQPGSIYADVYGRQRLLDLIGENKYDAVFLLQDPFVMDTVMPKIKETQQKIKEIRGKQFKVVYYFPIDATPKKEWIDNAIGLADYPVVYTKFGLNQIYEKDAKVAERTKVIYHGTNLEDFKPLSETVNKAFRAAYFDKAADDKFLIMNVNRNQPRKDIVRSLMVFKELKDRGEKDIMMYMHMQHSDVGGNIFEMMKQLGLSEEEIKMPSPRIFSANQGLPIEQINRLYGAADMVLTTTLGEGWGLSITEAMATKTPVVGPQNTSLTEMMADNRGILVPAGNNPSMFVMKENDMERIRPLMDVEAAADAIIKLKRGEIQTDIDGAYEWAQKHSWKVITAQFLEVINEAITAAREESSDLKQREFLNRSQRRSIKKKRKKK